MSEQHALENYITQKQLQKILKRSRPTIIRYEAEGVIRPIRMGGKNSRKLYRASDVTPEAIQARREELLKQAEAVDPKKKSIPRVRA